MLEPNVMHCFRKECDRVIKIMRHTIAVNGSLFYLFRMLVQYLHNAYRFGGSQHAAAPRACGALNRSNRTEERATS
jgi:hypothetical protein